MTSPIPRPWLIGHPEPAEPESLNDITKEAYAQFQAFRDWLNRECGDLGEAIYQGQDGDMDLATLYSLLGDVCDGTYVPKEKR